MSIAEFETDQFNDYAARLREIAVGCRLGRARWGIRKTVGKEHKAEAAELFGANVKRLSASKTLIDTANERYRAVSKVFSQVTEYWKDRTTPFTQPGVRLLRREFVPEMEDRIAQYQSELDGAVTLLERDYSLVLESARRELNRLFQASDYPQSLEGLFAIRLDYPSLEPDPSLVRVNSALYQRECARTRAQFEEAVKLTEEMFAEELRKLVTHISERLQGLNDGTAKRFDERNLQNLQAFFERFRTLSIGSSAELEQLVQDATRAVHGYRPEWLEESQPLRDVVRQSFEQIQQSLDGMMVARPRRRISWDE